MSAQPAASKASAAPPLVNLADFEAMAQQRLDTKA